MEYFLFVAYLIVFAWLVTKTPFFNKTGISRPQLVIIFFLKVIAGTFYGWMGTYYDGLAEMSDTWSRHFRGLQEYSLLQSDTGQYLTNLFHNRYPGGLGSFFGSTNSYWNDLKDNVFIKLLSIFDIFSFGHYYVNVIFYSFISLFGSMAFFRVMTDIYKGKRIEVLLAVFFIPSFFYWDNGIHKEGLVFTAIAVIIYHIYFANKEGKWSSKRWMGILLGTLVLLVLRNFVVIVLLPAVMAWLLANRYPRYGLSCFTAVYCFFGILFFNLRYVDPKLDFPQAVVDKQQAFIQIVGNSSIPIKQLKPTAVSFIKNVPQAITLSTFRPYPTDIHHLPSLAASIEIGILLILFLLSLAYRNNDGTSRNIVYFCTFFSLSLLLAIGFSVNNLGAIVRYRSIVLPLLMTPIVARIDWNRLFSIFSSHTEK